MVNMLLLGLASGALAATLVTNGDFEAGLQGWSTGHTWYEKPPGAGLSEISVAQGEGRQGSNALKIVGKGNRGIAMQVLPAYPGKYRIAGWVKCQDLEAGQAGVLAEWMGAHHTWLRGDWAVTVQGTRDWTRFDTVVEPAPGTRSVHLDLLADEPNHGTVWFDDITMERIPTEGPPPDPPRIAAETPVGQEGCLEVTWDPPALGESTVLLLIYCELPPLDVRTALPRGVAVNDAGSLILYSLENGQTYQVAAVAVDADGRASDPGITQATVSDRQAPRPGWIEARLSLDRRLTVGWSPHVLDEDIRRVYFCVPGADGEPEVVLEADPAEELASPRPFYCTAPLLQREFRAPAEARQIGVRCEDGAGNLGDVAWTEIRLDTEVSRDAPCALWTVPPTSNVPRDASPPGQPQTSFQLAIMRGQAKGFQVVALPEADLHRASVAFGPLHSETGHRIDPRWMAYHFVTYVNLEKNSRATPPAELVWPAPADYPDELSDDRERDLPAGRAQPIYIRITVPRDAVPGVYRGQAALTCEEGSRSFEYTVTVLPVELPADTRLQFVYWYGWDTVCQRFEVPQYSEDGWRVLSRLAELMKAHHQNCTTVPWTLIRSWRKPDGTLVHDFRDLDRYLQVFAARGVDRLFCMNHIGGRSTGEWECPTMVSWTHAVRDLTTGRETSIDVVDLLPAIQEHVQELGLLDRFAIHIADEPIPVNLESYRQLSARAHAAAPLLRRIDAIHVPDLRGSLEIWVPQINYFAQWLDQFREAQREGNEIWFYVAWVPQGRYPNRMIDSAAIKPRVLHWLNALYDTTGYLHWALNWWDISLMSLQSPGDQYITWPSRRYIANSSLRYEAEREGLEDCELMFMLRDALQRRGATREQAQAQMEAIGRKAVHTFEDYTRSWDELEAVRAEMIRRLTAG